MGLPSLLRIDSTPIAQGWSAGSKVGALLLALGAVAYDLWVPWAASPSRFVLAAFALFALAGLPNGGLHSVGLTYRVLPQGSLWLRATGVAGCFVVLAVFALHFGLQAVEGGPSWILVGGNPIDADSFVGSWLWFSLPVVEEVLYRGVLCTALFPWLGARGTILVGSFAFGCLHWRYEMFALNHLFAGAVLSWAFLRSGSLLVPLLWHWLGNAAVFLVALWLHA